MDGSLRHIGIFQELMTEVEAADGEITCVTDNRAGREDNHICAVETTITNQEGAQYTVISVAGFDHEQSEVRFDKVECPEFPEGYFGQTSTDPNGEPFTRTRADMVTDGESLVNYVKTIEEHITNEIKTFRGIIPGYDELIETQRRGVVVSRASRLRPCWREEGGPWKSEEIYFYLVSFTDKLYGIFNGLNAEFEDGTLLLYDGCIEYGESVRNILDQEGRTDGFLEYYWSDPRTSDDLVVDDSGNPIRGLSPGTSVKLGYFLESSFGGSAEDSKFVIGSGIYPDQEYYVPDGGVCQDVPDDLSEAARARLGEFPVFPEQKQPEQSSGGG